MGPPICPGRRPQRGSAIRRRAFLYDGGDGTESRRDREGAAAAATALSGFFARHGDDPRAEDASYLLVLALQRIGDARATRPAAREYLQRYPRGFRRAEAEALARGSP